MEPLTPYLPTSLSKGGGDIFTLKCETNFTGSLTFNFYPRVYPRGSLVEEHGTSTR